MHQQCGDFHRIGILLPYTSTRCHSIDEDINAYSLKLTVTFISITFVRGINTTTELHIYVIYCMKLIDGRRQFFTQTEKVIIEKYFNDLFPSTNRS